jgi:hypothetical protein
VKETDAIFANLNDVHARAAACPTKVLRLSLDAKATVLIGPFSRGGQSRTGAAAVDHDFKPEGLLTPFGLYLVGTGELELYFTATKVSSDFIADVLEGWWARSKERFPEVQEIILDLDNGPENSGQRSQFLYRLAEFARTAGVKVTLAYYPPYHSKYNPIERCWGALENYWRGELLDSEAAVLGYAANMKWKGQHPRVERVTKTYVKGVRRSKAEKRETEKCLQRKKGLEKWAVTIPPPQPGPVN